LRRELTSAEALVWERVRDRKFRGLKFRRQHPIGAYVVDFFCDELRLVLEVDGGVHLEPEQQARDLERQAIIESLGLRVFRISNSAVETDLEGAIDQISHAQTSPLPPQWERGQG
jgi:very-short-patch-repair endonuclease